MKASTPGPNAARSLAEIHAGRTHFTLDTATAHPQIRLLQRVLNCADPPFPCGAEDGRYGPKTLSAVRSFQRWAGIKADGLFGPVSLCSLEERLLGGSHLDDAACTAIAADRIDGSLPSGKYKQSAFIRTDNRYEALALIRTHSENTPALMTAGEYLKNLAALAEEKHLTYRKLDCSGYTQRARGGLGYHGATTNFCRHSLCAGYIPALGGFDALIPGMEVHQGARKSALSGRYYMGHVGVYAGLHDFGDGKAQHAVYQSAPGYRRLTHQPEKSSGPALTAMSSDWNYWAWSRYIRLDD